MNSEQLLEKQASCLTAHVARWPQRCGKGSAAGEGACGAGALRSPLWHQVSSLAAQALSALLWGNQAHSEIPIPIHVTLCKILDWKSISGLTGPHPPPEPWGRSLLSRSGWGRGLRCQAETPGLGQTCCLRVRLAQGAEGQRLSASGPFPPFRVPRNSVWTLGSVSPFL